MRTRRLISRFVAAAFFLMALQQLAALPTVRTAVRTEQTIARGASARKWKEALPAPAATVVRELAVEPVSLPAPELPAVSSETFALRRFQLPPPIA